MRRPSSSQRWLLCGSLSSRSSFSAGEDGNASAILSWSSVVRAASHVRVALAPSDTHLGGGGLT